MGVIFPAHLVEARFVVAMAMAANDIQTSFADVLKADSEGSPDWTYRIRIVNGHLLEALDSFDAYSTSYAEVRALIARIDHAYRKNLKIMRRTRQLAGSKALQHMRNSTFHYPSPSTSYTPTSDQRLEEAMLKMAARGTALHVNGTTKAVTLTFASEIALELSALEHKPDQEGHRKQLEAARDGALAFRAWVQALTMAYMNWMGATFGTPEIIGRVYEPPADT
jgi:hypothetical protein